MIVGTMQDCQRYAGLHPGLARGFDFLRRPDLIDLPDGRIEIDGERLFALVARGAGRGLADSPLEVHRRYVDIQCLVAGHELFGWSPLQACRDPKAPFDQARDIGFFNDPPLMWCQLSPLQFAIFFPEDAHAPLAGTGEVHKVVVKVELLVGQVADDSIDANGPNR